MAKRIVALALTAWLLTGSALGSDFIKWVDFDVGYRALSHALDIDVQSHETEQPLDWIRVLALAATRHGGGDVSPKELDRAAEELRQDASPSEFLGEQYKIYQYYLDAYEAALGGLVGSYAVELTDENGEKYWQAAYGLKAFSPIAAGYWYNHYADFGNSRSYGFARRHLGNDLMGSLGTPVVAVESGTVEAMGWNQYGGWRVGIRSADRRRYYYYAHLRKDDPYAAGLKEGDTVQAGDVIGFMGRTGYSTKENVNNIETVHLHFGMELVFDESQKECNSEIWIDVYDIVCLLDRHRSSVARDENGCMRRIYRFCDLDTETLPDA